MRMSSCFLLIQVCKIFYKQWKRLSGSFKVTTSQVIGKDEIWNQSCLTPEFLPSRHPNCIVLIITLPEKCPSLYLTKLTFPGPSQVLSPSKKSLWSPCTCDVFLRILTAVCHSFVPSTGSSDLRTTSWDLGHQGRGCPWNRALCCKSTPCFIWSRRALYTKEIFHKVAWVEQRVLRVTNGKFCPIQSRNYLLSNTSLYQVL